MKAEDRREKIAVVVGTVTNDVRILTVPKLKVCVVLTTLVTFIKKVVRFFFFVHVA